MIALPIDDHLPRIVAAARESRAVVLVAEPGAGKTTRVAPALLAANVLSAEHPNLIMLQPRRVAARAAAERIADEQNWRVGGRVGYQIRFERRIGPETRLRVLTEGILNRQLLDDPFLEGVGAVLLDEFHERSLHTDVAIALLREVRQAVRPDLVLIVMSATLDAEPVAAFLGNCPIVRVEGRTYPVRVEHRAVLGGAGRAETPDAVAGAVRDLLASGEDDGGDVLIFLPGAEEIRRTIDRLGPLAVQHDLLVLPLYGGLSGDEQAAALRPSGRRKIIVATNIAETSLTIDGVRTVIDSGLARISGFDPARGMDRLELKRISRASATQRAGRAGRTAPGRCIRLWSAAEDRSLEPFEAPEIKRVDLCSTVLGLHAWSGRDVRSFGWFEAPSGEAIESAERLLHLLGALDGAKQGGITSIGRQLLAFPLHPRLGRLMLESARWGMLNEGATLAALMEAKDVLAGSSGGAVAGTSDLIYRAELLAGNSRLLDPAAAREVSRSREALLRIGRSIPVQAMHPPADRDVAMRRLILLAYPDRVARRRAENAPAAVMVGGAGLQLARESVVRSAKFFVALDARSDDRSRQREALVRIASAIEPEWLEELFPQSIRRERGAVYDEARSRVVGRGQEFYLDLLLREDQDAQVDPQEAGRILGAALRPRAEAIFTADDASAQWLARLKLLREKMPEIAWPAADATQLGDLIEAASAGKRSLEEVTRQPLIAVLEQLLAYPLDRQIEQHAPAAMQVPSGSRIRLDYLSGRPVLSVRLQEVFGWTDTPRVAGGRVPVLLHLLAPNHRAVQITDDLGSFWASAYFQVRKDLRTRYPKHSWPEDPLSAKPEAKGRPRGAAG